MSDGVGAKISFLIDVSFADDADITKLISDESDESISECSSPSTSSLNKKDDDSGYFSNENSSEIDNYLFLEGNDIQSNGDADADCVNDSHIDLDTLTVLEVEPQSTKEVISFQADNNTNSQLDGFIIIAETNESAFDSNVTLALNKENLFITLVENDSILFLEDQCKEVKKVTSPEKDFIAGVQSKTSESYNKTPNVLQCNRFKDGVAVPSDTISIDLGESSISKVALTSNEDHLILEAVHTISDGPDESLHISASSPNIIHEFKKGDLDEEDRNPDEFVKIVENPVDDSLPIDLNEVIPSEVSLTSNDRDLVTQVENKIDISEKSDSQVESLNAGENLPDNNPPVKGSTCLNVAPALMKETANEIDYKLNQGSYIDAKSAEVDLCTTDYDTSTPASGIIESKNDIPSRDVADSTSKKLPSKNELKNYTQYVKIYCTECGESPWNVKYKTNRNCGTCQKKTLLNCFRCDKNTQSMSTGILEHLRYRCVPIDTLYQCSDCDYNTRAKNAYKKHVLAHKPSENIHCTWCGKSLKKVFENTRDSFAPIV
ncbi:hypothetical protein TSAR_011699 [Trichomalopsis sarcophagae]|uniref:C2H2-type domain-containing protein n=1 Tax=Trichomalopsis sarcophagae TaxID=543379 RepID=A0A232EFL3_9HYME|nr:hypothetical protein TSAR_011699 [Trichomalopsis sarcophagae]